MDLFHGTSRASLANILGQNPPPNTVDVTLGGGEFGRGFYVGTDPVMAASLARGKFKRDAAVIEFNVDNRELLTLQNYIIRRRDIVYWGWRTFIAAGLRNTHLFNTDLVIGPYALFDFSKQYKFESKTAENVINSSPTRNIL